jgi:CheY-like chemotaxis protein/anti-sigma regulatory factor (Ser/Thr protein kinase)
VGLHLIVKEALRLLRASLPTTIAIEADVDRKCPPVMADPSQLHQVVMNLCTNAAHAMHARDGCLEVSLRELEDLSILEREDRDLTDARYLCLTVRDTGVGMDVETMKHIFEPFFTTKEEGKGTGLGLSVVHGIVLSHGGEIEVESELGKGTVFHVYLPCMETSLPTLTIGDDDVEGGDECILFIDDDTYIAGMAEMMLKSFGYDVTARTSSVSGLDIFRRQPDKFDLLITDQLMPGMTGLQFVAEIRKMRPEIPVVLITGFSEPSNVGAFSEYGIEEILRKPISRRDMGLVIRRALDRGGRPVVNEPS